MRGIARSFLLLFSFLTSFHVLADARMIIHLADYLANDYVGAVGEDGSVKSESEYVEQKEFAQKILDEGRINPRLKDNAEIQNSIESLNEEIQKKSPPKIVTPLARSIQKSVLASAGIALSPTDWPDYHKARDLYATHCIQCHGPDGRGDGPLGKDLDPPPANFHDVSRAQVVSPFAAFNTIRLGVPGTGMGAYDFSDDEVWSLAFYVSI